MTLNDLITELQKLQPAYGDHRVHDWQLALLGQGYLTTFGFNDYEHRHRPPEPPPLVAVAHLPEVPREELVALDAAIKAAARMPVLPSEPTSPRRRSVTYVCPSCHLGMQAEDPSQ